MFSINTILNTLDNKDFRLRDWNDLDGYIALEATELEAFYDQLIWLKENEYICIWGKIYAQGPVMRRESYVLGPTYKCFRMRKNWRTKLLLEVHYLSSFVPDSVSKLSIIIAVLALIVSFMALLAS